MTIYRNTLCSCESLHSLSFTAETVLEAESIIFLWVQTQILIQKVGTMLIYLNNSSKFPIWAYVFPSRMLLARFTVPGIGPLLCNRTQFQSEIQ